VAPVIAAYVRKALWRNVFRAGGLTVTGTLPRGGCVVVANHSSHADAPALLAALDAGHAPMVAAAADYWFRAGWRAKVCRALVNGFAVRRTGGGGADLLGAVPALRSGRAVVVFAEGTRSRDGEVAAFHSGALRLAAAAGVPVVPVGLAGTRDTLPPHGTFRPRPVAVRIGAPLPADTTPAAAREAVVALASDPAPVRRSRWHARAAALAVGTSGLLLAFGWGFAEALVWPLVPELLVALVAVAAPKAGPRLALAAAAGSLAGGLAAYALGAAGVHPPAPLTTPRMHAVAAAQVSAEGAAALRHQPFSGIPYKVYAVRAGQAHVPVTSFVAWTVAARGGRILAVGLALSLAGVLLRRLLARCYGTYVAWLGGTFALSLHRVVVAWS
jgi:1-acyl-sn-glycerol-3-phosphate acyltransferase